MSGFPAFRGTDDLTPGRIRLGHSNLVVYPFGRFQGADFNHRPLAVEMPLINDGNQ